MNQFLTNMKVGPTSLALNNTPDMVECEGKGAGGWGGL